MNLLRVVDRFLRLDARVRPGDGLVVAFSGGPDSLALLAALAELSPKFGIALCAAHLDHALDEGSGERARGARRLALGLEVPIRLERRSPRGRDGRFDGGLEAAARRVRYDFLEEERRRVGARFIVTGHHLDDQAETVLLRLASGSGLEGLAGIAPVSPPLLRPLLSVRRSEILTFLEEHRLGERRLAQRRLSPVDDPSNRDLDRLRNRVRHHTLPWLVAERPDLVPRLAAVADRTRSFRASLSRRLRDLLSSGPTAGGARLDQAALLTLPPPLQHSALRHLHREAGLGKPPSSAARSELLRQLSRSRVATCDCGSGWRWRTDGEVLRLERRRADTPRFAYTLKVPGSVTIEQLSLRVRVHRSRVTPWMFRSSPHRAGLALPVDPGDELLVRNRRAGDRIQPLGWERHCRVKELLINRHVPRFERARLPFLCCNETIAWIPGVAVGESFRVSGQEKVWIAEIESLAERPTGPPSLL